MTDHITTIQTGFHKVGWMALPYDHSSKSRPGQKVQKPGRKVDIEANDRTSEGKALLDLMNLYNPKKVVRDHAKNPGDFKIRGYTSKGLYNEDVKGGRYGLKILDENGNLMSDSQIEGLFFDSREGDTAEANITFDVSRANTGNIMLTMTEVRLRNVDIKPKVKKDANGNPTSASGITDSVKAAHSAS